MSIPYVVYTTGPFQFGHILWLVFLKLTEGLHLQQQNCCYEEVQDNGKNIFSGCDCYHYYPLLSVKYMEVGDIGGLLSLQRNSVCLILHCVGYPTVYCGTFALS